LAAGWQPAAGRWRLAEISPAVSETTAMTARTERTPRIGTDPAAPFRIARMGLPAAAAPSQPERSSISWLSPVFLGLWALGATLLLAAYARSYSRIRHRLRSRPRVGG